MPSTSSAFDARVAAAEIAGDGGAVVEEPVSAAVARRSRHNRLASLRTIPVRPPIAPHSLWSPPFEGGIVVALERVDDGFRRQA